MKRSGSSSAFDRVVRELSRLPGIGKRSAERLTFALLKAPADEAKALADAIRDLKDKVRHCSTCYNVTESDPCAICADAARDAGTILVVEQPGDVVMLETTGVYRGLYHVLMGRLAPLEGLGPGELNVQSLLDRVKGGSVQEVILGTNPTLEGDGTALYLADAIEKLGVHVTRLARGLPTGASLDVLSKAVLADAIHGRQGMTR